MRSMAAHRLSKRRHRSLFATNAFAQTAMLMGGRIGRVLSCPRHPRACELRAYMNAPEIDPFAKGGP